jgi:hypothetical protein
VRRVSILVAALLAATACRTLAPVAIPLAPDDPRPALLLDAWAHAAGERRGLRARARLAVDGGSGAVRLRGKQILVLERPSRLRVEILGLLGQTVAVLTTEGERFELFRAEDRSYETGDVHPDLLWEQAYLALTPEEAIDLLLGLPAPDRSLALVAALGDGAGGVSLELADAAGRLRRRAGFDAEGRLRWLEALDGADALVWRAEFDEYAAVGGEPFAHAVSIEVSAGRTRAEISLRDVELNPELPPDIFRLRAPEGAGAQPDGGG